MYILGESGKNNNLVLDIQFEVVLPIRLTHSLISYIQELNCNAITVKIVNQTTQGDIVNEDNLTYLPIHEHY